MPDDYLNDAARLRKGLLVRGYTPLPNLHKVCMKRKWPKVKVTEAEIDLWSRLHPDFRATGVRLQDGLAVIDLDINHSVVESVLDHLEHTWPALLKAPLRRGKGWKVALFCRTAKAFNRLRGYHWQPAGSGVDDPTHAIEIFGGGSARQFGVFGNHSPGVVYSWDGPSLLRIPLPKLPIFTKSDFHSMIDAVDGHMAVAGWQKVPALAAGEDLGKTVYSLDDDMAFDMLDGSTVGLGDLTAYNGSRCSASFIEGAIAQNLTRCLVAVNHAGLPALWDSKTGSTFLPTTAAPVDRPRLKTLEQFIEETRR